MQCVLRWLAIRDKSARDAGGIFFLSASDLIHKTYRPAVVAVPEGASCPSDPLEDTATTRGFLFGGRDGEHTDSDEPNLGVDYLHFCNACFHFRDSIPDLGVVQVDRISAQWMGKPIRCRSPRSVLLASNRSLAHCKGHPVRAEAQAVTLGCVMLEATIRFVAAFILVAIPPALWESAIMVNRNARKRR